MAFSHALELSSKIDCINGCLLERMVYIDMALTCFALELSSKIECINGVWLKEWCIFIWHKLTCII